MTGSEMATTNTSGSPSTTVGTTAGTTDDTAGTASASASDPTAGLASDPMTATVTADPTTTAGEGATGTTTTDTTTGATDAMDTTTATTDATDTTTATTNAMMSTDTTDTTGVPGMCPPEPGDNECDMCLKGPCCGELTACYANPDCACQFDCLTMGSDVEQCSQVCMINPVQAELQTLTLCAMMWCGPPCML